MLSNILGKKKLKVENENLKLELEEMNNSYKNVLGTKSEYEKEIEKYRKLVLKYKQDFIKITEENNDYEVKIINKDLELEKYKQGFKEIFEKSIAYETEIKNKDLELERYKELYGNPSFTESSTIDQVNIYDNDKSFFDYIIDITGNPFNEQQIASIRYNMEKHLRIIAGAGSGKTETICAKAAYLKFVKKIDEKEIAMITFTRKAAKEMRERVNKFLGVEKSLIKVGTFHNIFIQIYNQIIQKQPELKKIGVQGDDPIEGAKKYNDLLKRLINKYKLYAFDKEGEQTISERLSYWTSMGYSNTEIKNFIHQHFDEKFKKEGYCLSEVFYRMIEEFQKIRKNENIVVFDDFLLNLYYVLKDSIDARDIAQSMYKFIFIDEFQDTNPLQMKIIELICPRDIINTSNNKTKLIIVGDDDQSIYAFRASDPSYIKDFSNVYNTHTIELMTNYRSIEEIVKAGNRVIAFNKHDRISKSMIPFHKKKGENYVIFTKNQKHEAKIIIEKCISLGIKEESFKYGNKLEKINYTKSVVLYRSKSQLTDFIAVLTENGVPFVIEKTDDLLGIFNYPFFVQFFNSWIDLVTKKRWSSIYNTIASSYYIPFSKIRDFTGEICDNSLDTFLEFLNGNSRSNVDSTMIKRYLKFMLELTGNKEININNFIQMVFEFPKVKKEMDQVQKEEILSICKNLNSWDELYRYYCKLKKQQDEMKEKVELYHQKKYNALYLLTIHSSKGLAFSNVFIIGAYDSGIPSSKAISVQNIDANIAREKAEPITTIEEERRLMYVAVTRARNNLYITYPKNINNRPIECSPFLKELNLPAIDFTKQ
ncbi:ATP-dependent helicase [Lysinibacillus sp. G4S2]|uniref:ATP-dependent helicase n=1 Tax=Lysinibacillus sp. G4S2 TaxID=3055859 RepID=UPI0025A18352|nr:ATP-dependent helicase [Lysinibacillus sp. G4S2]MDM5246328.1 ATP-dependent helicase [Lysinibacillus sp. G4S2]